MSTALIQSTGVRGDVLQSIRESLGDCTRCILSKGRKQIVFGVGNPDADLVVVGEAPGRDEDIQGEPFVGKAGQLLTDILQAIGLSRQDVYICNVVKCRPPENRNPEIEEIETCLPYLQKQIEAIAPKLILTVGKFAAQTLLQTDRPISKLRGCFVDYNGVPLMPTYHPAFLLRNPSAKKEVWEDVKQVHARLSELTGKTYSLKGAK
ncbi:MAG: uracil-DNA glycosylase [Bdellovibrionota bacterium]